MSVETFKGSTNRTKTVRLSTMFKFVNTPIINIVLF